MVQHTFEMMRKIVMMNRDDLQNRGMQRASSILFHSSPISGCSSFSQYVKSLSLLPNNWVDLFEVGPLLVPLVQTLPKNLNVGLTLGNLLHIGLMSFDYQRSMIYFFECLE